MRTAYPENQMVYDPKENTVIVYEFSQTADGPWEKNPHPQHATLAGIARALDHHLGKVTGEKQRFQLSWEEYQRVVSHGISQSPGFCTAFAQDCLSYQRATQAGVYSWTDESRDWFSAELDIETLIERRQMAWTLIFCNLILADQDPQGAWVSHCLGFSREWAIQLLRQHYGVGFSSRFCLRDNGTGLL